MTTVCVQSSYCVLGRCRDPGMAGHGVHQAGCSNQDDRCEDAARPNGRRGTGQLTGHNTNLAKTTRGVCHRTDFECRVLSRGKKNQKQIKGRGHYGHLNVWPIRGYRNGQPCYGFIGGPREIHGNHVCEFMGRRYR